MRLINRCVCLAVVFVALSGATAAQAKPKPAERPAGTKAAHCAEPRKPSATAAAGRSKDKAKHDKAQSIGPPNAGRLEGGARLSPAKRIHLRKGAHPFGLPVLVSALRKAATAVARKNPGATLLVGDLSAKNGGPLDGHNSHQSGRDADVGFFVTNSKGKPVSASRFVSFTADGRTPDSWMRFDDARNWALVEALLSNEEAHVRYIFVSHPLRDRLLAQAAKKKAADDLIARARAAMMSPKDADLHDDHFHIRVACPESMRASCVEESTPREPAPREPAASAATPPGAS